ncbi:hypothetical protein KC19_6G079500 [Ceratodon purpureus]|uniref:Isopenicillin N synthase-like Fe(2+) 2OG dioxygenase domain-containing protein n=1 Tax=Ceratodon purpureus TaxID=3225 RepID=A0A8T0HFM0_CERPU|nr:hypothetical protein KC19_6G079500 [Ceratodon purpureus]
MELAVIDLEPFLKWRAAQTVESELPVSSGPGGDGGRDVGDGGDGGMEVGMGEVGRLRESCARVAACLRETGALVIRDPRCSMEDNDRFLDMMERYFGQTAELKRQQERPLLHYQVGVTPEGVEVPRCSMDPQMQELMRSMPSDSRPVVPVGPDRKWRYMWRIGPRPTKTRFQELNAEPVIPESFPEWVDVMNGWGHKMIAAVEVVAEMAALGFGLPKTAFTSLMKQGPHLLAPTGSDLSKYGDLNNVFAGYHYDLNFLTIHGRSRFPGLFIWLKDGRKVPVKVPEGCLLLQAGKQLEWLTGGECAAGMHEVVVSENTLQAVEASRKAGRSLWRVSSTMFAHIASDEVLKPLGHFAKATASTNYPPMCAGEYVEAELAAINLKNSRPC